MKLLCITAFLLIGSVCCQNDIIYDVQNLEKIISKIPSVENFPSLDEIQVTLRKKCQKNGGDDAFEKLLASKNEFQQYLQNNFNFTIIQEEIETYKKSLLWEDFFVKYCDKRPLIQAYAKNMTNAIEPCLEEEEKSSMKLILNMTESLVSFVCRRDGGTMAIFIVERGFECLDSKRDGLQQCVNETLVHRIPEGLSLTNLSPFSVNKEELCGDLLKLQKCAVQILDTCNSPVPSNAINALFKFMRKDIFCNDVQEDISDGHQSLLNSTHDDVGPKQEPGLLLPTLNQIGEKYELTCLKNSGEKAAEEFRETLKEVAICYESAVRNFQGKLRTMGILPYDYLCKDFRTNLRECLVNLSSKVEACVSPAEAYVPKFGLDFYDSVFDFYCKDNAKVLKKVIGVRDACFASTNTPIMACLHQTIYIKNYANGAIITKPQLCGDIYLLKRCFMKVSTQTCPDNNEVMEFYSEIADAFYAPCSADADNIVE